jgi:hypothetical protein
MWGPLIALVIGVLVAVSIVLYAAGVFDRDWRARRRRRAGRDAGRAGEGEPR